MCVWRPFCRKRGLITISGGDALGRALLRKIPSNAGPGSKAAMRIMRGVHHKRAGKFAPRLSLTGPQSSIVRRNIGPRTRARVSPGRPNGSCERMPAHCKHSGKCKRGRPGGSPFCCFSLGRQQPASSLFITLGQFSQRRAPMRGVIPGVRAKPVDHTALSGHELTLPCTPIHAE